MEFALLWFVFWFPLSIAVAILANRYNRSATAWFITSVLLSPVIGFAFVLALGPVGTKPAMAGYQPRTGDRAPDNPPNQGSAAITYYGSRFRPGY
jgi:hypothetical protein